MDKSSEMGCKQEETDLLLQWGNRKRLRCVRVRDSDPSYVGGGRFRRKLVAFSEKETCSFQTATATGKRLSNSRNSEMGRRVSPEKEDKYCTRRGSVDCDEESQREENNKSVVWPKLFIGLSSKEKEEDFMAMKGCKLPHRPKKRAKIIQRSLVLVSPGAWLTDMCQERYEVREKKTCKKKPRGLKAMGGMESDSE